MILGLSGKNASGKGEVAEFLEGKGFYYHSLSDVLRETLTQRGDEVTRDNLVRIGRELRKEHGEGYLAEQVLARAEADRNYVIDSFRHPAEVEVFRRAPRFYLLWVEADPAVRFDRIRSRGRESDPETLEDFQLLEEAEAASEESQGQQLDACRELADFRVPNDGELPELHRKVSDVLARLSIQMERPSWDDYFMSLAKVASLRSNCIKRKVAAVIVRDRRVITTGYNGTPRGTRNCSEGGCPRCNSWAESGTRLEECLCSHGEENAITQAAFHGVSVRDSTLYTTFAPCLMCTKMIINAGIREVVYNQDYPLNAASLALLGEAGVALRRHRVD